MTTLSAGSTDDMLHGSDTFFPNTPDTDRIGTGTKKNILLDKEGKATAIGTVYNFDFDHKLSWVCFLLNHLSKEYSRQHCGDQMSRSQTKLRLIKESGFHYNSGLV